MIFKLLWKLGERVFCVRITNLCNPDFFFYFQFTVFYFFVQFHSPFLKRTFMFPLNFMRMFSDQPYCSELLSFISSHIRGLKKVRVRRQSIYKSSLFSYLSSRTCKVNHVPGFISMY